jgi:hypothetical protein
MGNAPDVPKVADPNQVATQQQELNTKSGQQSQAGSMVNQSNPYGSLTYNQTGTSPDGTPLYTATTKLSDANQQLLDILQGTQKTAGQQGQALLSGANYGAQQPKDVIGDMSGGWLKDAMAKQMSYLQPQMDYDVSKLDSKLKNQGFNPGTPGYDKAMNALKQSQGQTITGFEASQQPELLKQAQQMYMMPATLGTALAGLGQNKDPQWTQTPALNIQPANLIGATANANDANMKAYQAEADKYGGMMSGIFGVPSAILGGWAQNGGMQSLLGSTALAAL